MHLSFHFRKRSKCASENTDYASIGFTYGLKSLTGKILIWFIVYIYGHLAFEDKAQNWLVGFGYG